MFVNIADQALSDQDFKRISQAIYKHCGINLTEAKSTLIKARLAKRLKATGHTSLGDYINYVLSPAGQKEFGAMVDVISTNFTSFFREVSHFDYLRQHVLAPRLEKYPRGGKINAWSAACSSGEEPYTLAITLLEATQGRGNWDLKILASDVSTRMLEMAQMGTYDMDRIAPLTPMQIQKFMVPSRIEDQKVYQVAPMLRQMITFRHINLMENWPFKEPFDFIFCRNVMIYFDKPTQERLVNRMMNHLIPGGLLFIGHSESLTGTKHNYRYVAPAIYMRPD